MTRLQFDDRAIDLAVREISGPAGVRKLEPRAAQVLELLLERPGEVVGRADLLDRCWPDGGGSDEALSQSIAQLRRALGDDPKRPRFVRTIHKSGYQWVAKPTQAVVKLHETPVTRSSRLSWTPMGALAFLVLAAAAYVLWGRSDDPPLTPQEKAFVASGGRIERVNRRVDEGPVITKTETVTHLRQVPGANPSPPTRSPETASPSG